MKNDNNFIAGATF